MRAPLSQVRMRYTLMFEQSALGAIFPSYDVESRLLDTLLVDNMGLYANIGLGMVIFFCVMEVSVVNASCECLAVLLALQSGDAGC